MKKGFLTVLFIAFTIVAICQNVRIVEEQSNIGFLESKINGNSEITQTVKVKVEFWSNKKIKTDLPLKFVISRITNVAKSGIENNAIVNIPVGGYFIDAKKFKNTHDTISFDLNIKQKAVPSIKQSESFDIQLSTANALTDPSHKVIITKEDPDSKTNKSDPTPTGFSFVNAVNFDFDGATNSNYVGHFNIFKPELIYLGKNKIGKKNRFFQSLGLNVGIMKINYSKGGDSLNKEYFYFEDVLVKPLDKIEVGAKTLRQCNKITTTSKNTTWSFYFQPTVSIYQNENVKLLFHLHDELFVDKWTTTINVSNIQQDTLALLTPDLERRFNKVNKFSKSPNDILTTTSTSTKINFNYGLGLTLQAKLWPGGLLFAQTTVTCSKRSYQPQSIDNNSLKYTRTENLNCTTNYLTRLSLQHNISSSIDAVIGIDVRGKFNPEPTYSPTYAAYLGLNVGLEGITGLLGKK